MQKMKDQMKGFLRKIHVIITLNKYNKIIWKSLENLKIFLSKNVHPDATPGQ